MMKQLKNLENEYEKLKQELSLREHVLEKGGIVLRFDGLGNIKSLEIHEDISSKPISDLREDLTHLMQDYQDMVKDNLSEAIKDKFLGSLPFGF